MNRVSLKVKRLITITKQEKSCTNITGQNKKENNKMKKVIIDEIEYVANEQKGNVKIVILQRGWVMVGRFERNGSDCKLNNASVIRSWGTTNGLGEIAKNGPNFNTKLDKTNGLVEFDYLTVVASISCEEKSWEKYL